MIVRDAERTLERALKSVAGHVDQIIVVDTGSVDNTPEIAARCGAHLDYFEWCDDFAAARQYAYDLCTTEWIIWLDADDEVLYADEIKPSLAAVDANVGALLWRYILARSDDGTVLQSAWRERCTRRGWYRWEGRCHEGLVPIGDHLYVPDESVEILHHGSGDPLEKARRNVRILELALEEEDPPKPHTLFYLARDTIVAGGTDPTPLLEEYLRVAEPLKDADLAGEHYLALTPAVDQRYYAQLLLAHCHRQRGKWQAAEQADLAALAISPQWPQAYFGLASDYFGMGRFRWVIHWTDIARGLPEPQNTTFPISALAYDSGWRLTYSAALARLGALRDALDVTREGLLLEPANDTLRHNERALEHALAGA
jgi:hypothetical protein